MSPPARPPSSPLDRIAQRLARTGSSGQNPHSRVATECKAAPLSSVLFARPLTSRDAHQRLFHALAAQTISNFEPQQGKTSAGRTSRAAVGKPSVGG
jgi:hypothetical protein